MTNDRPPVSEIWLEARRERNEEEEKFYRAIRS
jgi:hypothetical protein